MAFCIFQPFFIILHCGMYTIQWDVDSLDWKDPAPEDITARVLKRVQPGSIVLFHNAAKNTPAALPGVIEGLIQKGYTIVPLQVYFKGSLVKVKVGLCKGKKLYDKRQSAAEKDAKRQIERAMKERY